MIKDEKRCKNCNQHLLMNQKYCHECGQKTDTHRINFHFLLHEIQHGIFHVDGGILFTIKELFTRPGHSLREYLEGKRKAHFPPLMLVLIIGSLCALVQYFFKNNHQPDGDKVVVSKLSTTKVAKYIDFKGFIDFFKLAFEWLSHHFAFTILLMLTAAALGFFLGFRKYKYNYSEWLVVMLFLAGQSLTVYVFFIFLNKFLGNYTGFFYLISWGLVTFSLLQFFMDRPKKFVIFRTIWSIFLSYLFSVFYVVVGICILALIGLFRYGHDNIINDMLH